MKNTESVPTDSVMRKAVAARDLAYDGRFVYAVVTTGVFCRPSCAARKPRPENVRFFLTAEAAAAAGYRPCKRCRPERAVSRLEALVDVARYIEANAERRLTLAALGERAGLSPSRLQRAFKSAFGVSPKAFQEAVRTNRLKSLLRRNRPVTEAIFGAGYGSISRVYGAGLRNVGMTPKAYRAGGAGETISYACRATALGPLMMAATERGVCSVQFGADEAELLDGLQREFPHAQLLPSAAGGSPLLDAWMQALDAHLSAGAPRPELPLDLRGTAFQMKVWRFLLSVAEGDVVSYGEVARGIGNARAVRAAASACAANRIAVLVPCHRVLRGDGGVGGYRWGLERKRALLESERKGAAPTDASRRERPAGTRRRAGHPPAGE